MPHPTPHAGLHRTALLPLAALLSCALCATPGVAQSVAQAAGAACEPARLIPQSGPEPPAKITVDAPLAGPLATRGVAIVGYCARNLHIAPVFGPGALNVSPRVGHVHVTVDEGPWVWADASGVPIILRGLPPGRHRVLVELADANHRILDRDSVAFVVPEKLATGSHR